MNERTIFEAAAEIDDPERRRIYLDMRCGGDASLRARMDALLASHEIPSHFLQVPAIEQIMQFNAQADHPPEGLPNSRTPSAPSNRHEVANEAEIAIPDLSFLSPSFKPGLLGVLGHYEILQVLGQGAFGLVLKAFDAKLHRIVAIKVLNPQLATTSPPRKRFLREARSTAAIKHENIVQIYSVEEHPLPYLVMEYIDGMTLQQKLDEIGPLEVDEILQFGRELAHGLAAAHAKGLIHRDIKPANIMLEQGTALRVKITDFGLARAADDASLTRSGAISGTPLYMAPEQATGAALDHRADLFSLGSVLYVMASGRPPFRAANSLAVLKRVAAEDPRPIREIVPEIPEALCQVIARLHAKSADDRIQSANEVASLLMRCQFEVPASAQAPMPQNVETVGQDPKPPKPRIVVRRDLMRSLQGRWKSWLAVAVLLAIASFALPGFRNGRQSMTQEPATATASAGPDEAQAVTVAAASQPEAADKKTDEKTNERKDSKEGTTAAANADEKNATGKKRPPSEFVQLFNGKDLTGWDRWGDRKAVWTVEDGVLVGGWRNGEFTGGSHLCSRRHDYQNFRFRIETQPCENWVGSMLFLWPDPQKRGGFYRAQIGTAAGRDVAETAILRRSLFDEPLAVPKTAVTLRKGIWFTEEVLVRGRRVEIYVNDILRTRYRLRDLPQAGHLGIGMAGGASMRIRKIEVQELPPPNENSQFDKTPLD